MKEGEPISIFAVFQILKAKTVRLLDPVFQAEGLTPLQARVLLHLTCRDATVGDISETSGMGQANASSLCKKLEREGFLTRRRSCPDRRVVTLSLTPKGREAMAHIQGKLDRYLELINARPEGEREELIRGLRTVEHMLDYLFEQTKGEQNPC